MAFASLRGVAYDVSQQLGRVNAAYGGGQFTQARATAYRGAKGLGDINAAIGAGRRDRPQALTGRVAGRVSGKVLRAGRTGIPVADSIIQRIVSEKTGSLAQTWETKFVDKNQVEGEVNYSALRKLEIGDAFQFILEDVGVHILKKVVNGVPIKSGEFKESFKVAGGRATDGRPVVVVYTDHWAWKYLEYGTRFMAPRAPIRSAIYSLEKNAARRERRQKKRDDERGITRTRPTTPIKDFESEIRNAAGE